MAEVVTGCLSSTWEMNICIFIRFIFKTANTVIQFSFSMLYYVWIILVRNLPWEFKLTLLMIWNCVKKEQYSLFHLGLQYSDIYICTSEVPGPFLLLAGNCGSYTEKTSIYSIFNCSPALVEASGNDGTHSLLWVEKVCPSYVSQFSLKNPPSSGDYQCKYAFGFNAKCIWYSKSWIVFSSHCDH